MSRHTTIASSHLCIQQLSLQAKTKLLVVPSWHLLLTMQEVL